MQYVSYDRKRLEGHNAEVSIENLFVTVHSNGDYEDDAIFNRFRCQTMHLVL